VKWGILSDLDGMIAEIHATAPCKLNIVMVSKCHGFNVSLPRKGTETSRRAIGDFSKTRFQPISSPKGDFEVVLLLYTRPLNPPLWGTLRGVKVFYFKSPFLEGWGGECNGISGEADRIKILLERSISWP
jgi:hypothetical protein